MFDSVINDPVTIQKYVKDANQEPTGFPIVVGTARARKIGFTENEARNFPAIQADFVFVLMDYVGDEILSTHKVLHNTIEYTISGVKKCESLSTGVVGWRIACGNA